MRDLQCIAPSLWPHTQFLAVYSQLCGLHFKIHRTTVSAVNGLRTACPRERGLWHLGSIISFLSVSTSGAPVYTLLTAPGSLLTFPPPLPQPAFNYLLNAYRCGSRLFDMARFVRPLPSRFDARDAICSAIDGPFSNTSRSPGSMCLGVPAQLTDVRIMVCLNMYP